MTRVRITAGIAREYEDRELRHAPYDRITSGVSKAPVWCGSLTVGAQPNGSGGGCILEKSPTGWRCLLSDRAERCSGD